MPEILTYNSPSEIEKRKAKENSPRYLSKSVYDWFRTQDKFTKTYIIAFLMIAIATPLVVGQYLEIRQRAAEPEKAAQPQAPVVTYENGEVLVTFRAGVKQNRIDKIIKDFNLTVKSQAIGIYDLTVDPASRDSVIDALSKRKEVQKAEKIPLGKLQDLNMKINIVHQAFASGDCTVDPADYALGSEENAFFDMINTYRHDNGLGPLKNSPTLQKSAVWKSKDMGVNNYFAHDDITRTVWQRVTDCGYDHNTWKGENIAAGYSTAANVFNAWQLSPGHNAIMLGPNYTVIGNGLVFVPGSNYTAYWTTDFGGYDDSIPTPADTTKPTVSIISPATGSVISGQATVEVLATDDIGISKVELYIDGQLIPPDTIIPYSFFWDTTAVTNGSHTLIAKAYDAAGNVGTSSTISVTINNLTPTSAPPPALLDSDGDGFLDSMENYLGTDPKIKCATAIPLSPAPNPAWPPDLTGDNKVNGNDLLAFNNYFGKSDKDPGFNVRFDLKKDGKINGSDQLQLSPYFGKTTCQ